MRKCRIYIYIHSVERIFSNVIPLKVGRKFWKIILSALIKWYKVWTSLFEDFSSLIRSDLLSIRFPPSSIPFNYLQTFEFNFSEKGTKFFCNNFQPWAEKLKEKIPSVRRNFTFSPGWKKIVPIVHPCIVQHHARLEILKFTATDARVARTSPRFRSTLLASFFLSFFLAVFFLTFWNRHEAERGSLTKVGNHTHRFHAMPHSSTGWPSWTGPRTLAPVSLE